MLTVKESLADSGRSSKTSGSSSGRRLKDREDREDRENQQQQQQQLLVAASPSDFLQETAVSLTAAQQQFGSFYLRLGTVSKFPSLPQSSHVSPQFSSVFGVGGIIYVGIEMGGLFTVGLHSNNLITCGEIFNILRPSLQIVFIFMQMHFVFLSHKMSLFRRKLMTRLGLSHLLVSNISLWLRALIKETLEAGHKGDLGDLSDRLARETENLTRSGLNTTGSGEAVDEEVICDGTVIFSLSRLTSPYLYPCLAQYSLICVAVVAAMWVSVSTEHRQLRSRGDKLFSSSCHRYSVDCNGSHAGLFCGVVMVVITIVSVILGFVFSNVSHNQLELSGLVRSLSDLALYSIALVAVLVGTCQIRSVSSPSLSPSPSPHNSYSWSLAYDGSGSNFLSKIILISSQSGVLLFAVSSALFCEHRSLQSLLSLGSHLVIILQTLLQTLFITDAGHRSVFTSGQLRRKPGRQVVSFLLVINLTLWVVNIIHSSQINFQDYQQWFWPIIMHFSLPLCILYRFYSAVNLYDIWSKAFQFRTGTATVEYI